MGLWFFVDAKKRKRGYNKIKIKEQLYE